MNKNNENLVWIDLEMTGLDFDNDLIIEIATIVTDSQLNILAEGPQLAIHQTEERMAQMDAWCQSHHGKSGLISEVLKSSITVQQAEEQTLAFLKQYVPENTSPMCGNSICADRRFLYRLMPRLEAFFHYRLIDVSTVKELAKRWSPASYKAVEKDTGHRAMSDVRESIAELAHYRELFFKLGV